ncbi:MAG: CHAT domain-containing protein, partial [Cyanobacteria bacterium SID2]|nr:CHAT domain-containing protein [Cyanobacteria bacterium SID2]
NDPNDPNFQDPNNPNDPNFDPNDPNDPDPDPNDSNDPNFDDFVDGLDNPIDLDITMTPADLANANGVIVLEANNDITISTPIANPMGIEILAGRSVNINANLNTASGNGDVSVVANDPGAAAGLRQPGPANIIQAPGASIDAGGGNVLLRIANADAIGDVQVGTITTRGSVEIDANGGNIVRSSASESITADIATFSTMGVGGIGTTNAPIRVSVNTLNVMTGSGGQFFDVIGGRRQEAERDIASDLEADVRVDEADGPQEAPDGESQGEFEGFDDSDGEVDGGFEDDRAEGPDGEMDGGFEDDRAEGSDGEVDERGEDDVAMEDDEGEDDSQEIGDDELDIEFIDGGDIGYGEEVEVVSALEKDRLQEFSAYIGNLSESTLSIQSAREALTDVARQTGTQSAVVYVTLLPSQLELVVFTADARPIRRSVPISRDRVVEVANTLREQLTNPRFQRTDGYLQPAQQLYEWTIEPILPDLEASNVNTILFSMPAGLRSLPIAGLHDGEQFLVEQFSLSLIPSLGLVDTRYRTLQNTGILAMGASEFGGNLAPLPAVPVELTTVTQEWWSGEAFINEAFTRENLVEQRRRHGYSIVHLATHGEFLSFEDSYIQLWDERLHLNQMRKLGWNNPPVELVVLSACRTAVGNEEAELGFAGFAVSAGVKSALASLWYVSDEGTLGLMTEFYSQLRETRTKAEALRQAQLSLLNGDVRVEGGQLRAPGVSTPLALPERSTGAENRDLSHPYYWSGFTMVGSPW